MYLYLFTLKKQFRKNPESSANVYSLWFWKMEQKQYSKKCWFHVHIPDLLISFNRSPGKVDEVLHLNTANTFRIPIHVLLWASATKGPAVRSPWVCLRPGPVATGQGSSEGRQWALAVAPQAPDPGLDLPVWCWPSEPHGRLHAKQWGEDTSPIGDLGPESTLPSPSQASAGGGGILWFYWPLAVCSLLHVPFWSSLFWLTGCPGL